MRLSLFAFFWLLVSSPIWAQNVTVRTGEHAQFTRVVLTLPDGMNWRFGRDPEGYVLGLPDSVSYQLDDFFDLIPRTRIEKVAQDRGRLRLAVQCVCNARAYPYGDNFLVIDVRDGPASRISSFELSLDPVRPQPNQNDTSTSRNGMVADNTLPLFFEMDGIDGSQAQTANSRFEPPVPALVEGAGNDFVMNISAEVATAMGAAMSEGVLDADLSSVEEKTSDKENMQFLGAMTLPGIEARTSIDSTTGLSGETAQQTQSGNLCLPDDLFAIESWGNESTFNVQMSQARQQIYGEFDQPDATAVTKLARLFLYFGFGKEALQTLSLDQIQSHERYYLRRMAEIIDGDSGVIAGFEGQVSCVGKVAMWAVLARDEEPLDATVDRASILRTFKTLPVHLRPLLGPRLARVFLGLNDQDAAEQVLARAITEGTGSVNTAIGHSDLAAISGNLPDAFAKLHGLISHDSSVTPEVMTRYFDLGISVGHSFQPTDFVLADAIRFQNRTSPDVDALRDAQFRALLNQDSFDEARELFSRESSEMEPEVRRILNTQFQMQAVSRLSDAAFGRLVWERNFIPENVEIQEMVVARLERLGFSNRAQEIAELARSSQLVGSINTEEERDRSEQDGVEFSVSVKRNEAQGAFSGIELDEASIAEQTSSITSDRTFESEAARPTLAAAVALLESAQTSREIVENRLLNITID